MGPFLLVLLTSLNIPRIHKQSVGSNLLRFGLINSKIYSLKIKINNNERLPKNFNNNFNSITIIVSGINHKPGCQKKIVEKVSFPEGSITPDGTLSLLLLLQTKQSKSVVISTLTVLLAIDKSACLSLAPSLVNAIAFELLIFP